MLKAMVDVDKVSRDKKPSPKLIQLIVQMGELAETYDHVVKSGRDLVKKIKEKGKSEGFGTFETGLIAREVLKDKFSPNQLNYWFPLKKNNVLDENTNRTNDENKETEHKDNQDEERETSQTEEGLQNDPEITRPINAVIDDPQTAEEEPSEEELAEITKAQEPPKPKLSTDECFQSLPDDNAMTCWKINKISGTGLKNRILSWQGNTLKFFRVWMQEVSKDADN